MNFAESSWSPAGRAAGVPTFFPDSLLEDLRRMPGANHSFVKQLSSEDGAGVRAFLDQAMKHVGAPLAERWTDVLTSLDNRRFFQGFGEAATAIALGEAGWRIPELSWPGPTLVAESPNFRKIDVLVLSFIRQVRPGPDAEVIDRLTRALNRVGSRSRIAVLVRRWLPHEFDPEPVRRAIELWLREVDRGGWDGRYAAYDDEHVSLEFALTGGRSGPSRPVVAFTIGPFDGQRTLEVLESRLVFELDAHRMRTRGAPRPVILSAICDQRWRISNGYLRELLYGKPVRCTTGAEHPGVEYTYDAEYSASLFRDPLYSNVAGLLMTERNPDQPALLRSVYWANPWCPASRTLAPPAARSLVAHRWEGESPVMRWVTRGA
jgi:hypothetical protein